MSGEIEIDHGEREHCDIGGSTVDRRLNCLGSLALESEIPPSEPSAAAKEGTEYHELLDMLGITFALVYNQGKLFKKKKDVFLDAFMEFPTKENWSAEMRIHAREWFSKIYSLIRTHKPRKVFSERKFHFRDLEPLMGGPADFFFAYQGTSGPELFILDAKYGRGKLVTEEAEQLPFYACACASEFPQYEFRKATVVIHQPRLSDEYGEVWRSKEYSKTNIKEHMEKYRDLHKRAYELKDKLVKARVDPSNWAKELDKHGHLTYGKDHCFFCKAAVSCPQYMKSINDQAVKEFEFHEVAEIAKMSEVEEDFSTHFIHLMDTPEKIGAFLDFVPYLKDLINKVEGRAITEILNGRMKIPGWKIVEGRSQRSFPKDRTTEIAAALIEMGLDPWEKKLIGIGATESLLKAKGFKKPEAKKKIEHLVVMSKPGKNLVVESDPREAITMNSEADAEFEDADILDIEWE